MTAPGFEEYAALARQLSARRRGGERAVAAEAERRRALHATADQLGRRLAAQGQRLDQLARAIGAAPTADPAATPADPAPTAAVGAGSMAGVSGSPVVATPPSGGSPSPASSGGTSAAGSPHPPAGTGAAGTGGAAAAPGRSGVGAYPEGAVGEAALPAPRPAEADPVAELDAARRLVDEADRYGQQAEAIAHRPALLPAWSPLARAVAVYAACGLAGAALLLVTAVSPATEAVGFGLVLSVLCTGVPVMSFLAGQLVLGRWGRPVVGAAAPPSRYVPLGFVICVLLAPSLFCVYALAFRLLR